MGSGDECNEVMERLMRWVIRGHATAIPLPPAITTAREEEERRLRACELPYGPSRRRVSEL